MQGNNGQQGNQGQQKPQGGLSWSQSPSGTGSTPNNNNSGASTPVKPVAPAMQSKPAAATGSMANKSSTNNYNAAKPASGGRLAGIFISGVIVGLIIGWGWFSLRNDAAKVAENANATTTEMVGGETNTTGTVPGTTGTNGTVMQNTGSLSATSKSSLSVALSGIAVTAPTWIAVMDNNAGKAGNALGAAMFFPGQKSGTIELLRGTVSGKTYLVGEYADNGDHKFSKSADTQVMGVAGNPMLVEFTAQ